MARREMFFMDEGYVPLPCPKCGNDLGRMGSLDADWQFTVLRPLGIRPTDDDTDDLGPFAPPMVPSRDLPDVLDASAAAVPSASACGFCHAPLWKSPERIAYASSVRSGGGGPGKAGGDGEVPCPRCGKDLADALLPTTYEFRASAPVGTEAVPDSISPDLDPIGGSSIARGVAGYAWPVHSSCPHCGGVVWDTYEPVILGPYFTHADLDDYLGF